MPKDNRIIIAIGAGLAVLAALIVFLVFGGGGRDRAEPAAPDGEGGQLTIDLADAPGPGGSTELDCYVDGQSVGKATLSDCARRNGVATGALDVGVDQSGAAVAFRPPPGPPALEEPVAGDPMNDGQEYAAQEPEADGPLPAPGAVCLRYAGSDWRTVSAGISLQGCVQALYSGVCVRPGEALYGRWGETTLRLVPRRVEQSSDNTRFRVLTEQDRGCQFPEFR